ncbi:DNA polymerase-3 subunit epsilon [Streptoalloteichus tenebrarius]|uniref:DNA polymerase-3 subunit epsilon n=1 Tax=Streptoalloteichus tenebrarius (strain ATCC 17920 / DSM 40477 / JCM 4838 / CBS 697.72 / NBRC 16177 / NCIMB 11028 / NRRL B-12390 / A12253. 1 / ISP 5477) TaxID=1933 RepID=A0ABT1HQL9_STRSD|nr:DNA polymerase-3 subunit epsilon [Streptoalloteichus tenebrarius]
MASYRREVRALVHDLALARDGEVPARDLEFTAVDFETTSLAPPGRVIEVGAVRMRGDGTVLAEMSTLVDPGPGVAPGATWVHRITREHLDGAPTMAEVIGDLLSLCEGSVLVAHNLAFEERFLAHELELLGLTAPPLPGLCTLRAARTHLGAGSCQLGALVEAFGLPAVAIHAALDDARACGQLLLALLAPPHELRLASRPRHHRLPVVPSSGRSLPRAAALRAGRRGWMACLMDRLPARGLHPPQPEGVAAYRALLTSVLAQGRITGPKAKLLARQAGRAGMSRADLVRVHRAVLEEEIARAGGPAGPGGQDGPDGDRLRRLAATLGLPDLSDLSGPPDLPGLPEQAVAPPTELVAAPPSGGCSTADTPSERRLPTYQG